MGRFRTCYAEPGRLSALFQLVAAFPTGRRVEDYEAMIQRIAGGQEGRGSVFGDREEVGMQITKDQERIMEMVRKRVKVLRISD